VAGQDRLLAVQRQVVAELRNDDVGKQPRLDVALRNRFWGQDGLGNPRVVALGLAGPVGVHRSDQLPDEDRHRLVVEPLIDRLANPDLGRAAAATHLFGVAQVDHLRTAGQIRRFCPAAVTLPLRSGSLGLGDRIDHDRGRRIDLLAEVGHHPAQFHDHGFGVGQLPSQVIRVLSRRHGGLNPGPRSG
jgi:hypothetical protein